VRSLELDEDEGDAVNETDKVRSALVQVGMHPHLRDEEEVIVFGVVPVDDTEPLGLCGAVRLADQDHAPPEPCAHQEANLDDMRDDRHALRDERQQRDVRVVPDGARRVGGNGPDLGLCLSERGENLRFAGGFVSGGVFGGSSAGPAGGPEAVVDALGTRPVVAHDAKSLKRIPQNLAHDTEIGAYLLEPARRAYPLRELWEERGLAAEVEDPAAADALLTAALARWQRDEIHARGLTDLLDQVELPLVKVLREMELAGCKLDTERLAQISAKVKDEAAALECEIFDLCGEEFMLGSPKQLEEVLFKRLGLSRKRRGKTGYSTDARVLQAIRHEHPVIPKIERWRELTKLAQTYLDALPLLIALDGRIHTTFNQTAATTGRLSSNNPNLQNIPIRTPLGREIRSCFVAAPGNLLVSADYSQVELRLLAHIAGEDVLKEIFRRGEDVHTATACRVFGVSPEQIDPGMRSKSKMINYGIVYGLSAWGMADRLDIPQEEADEFIQRYLAGFPAVARFISDTIEQGTERGDVSTVFGRRRQVPELRARRWEIRKQGERFAVNMVIQGTAADIMKVAMVRCAHALAEAGLRSRLILQIHDELLFEGPAEEAEAVRALACEQMEGAFAMDPPLKVDVGSGRAVRVEALARWPHPTQGMIPPDQFIPLAEQTGLLRAVSRWLLHAALAQARKWSDAGRPLSIAINLSMRDLQDPQLPNTVAAALRLMRTLRL